MTRLSFDELNQLVGYKRSMPYEKYFGEMRLTKKQKEERIRMAELLETVFLEALAFLYYTHQYGSPEYSQFEKMLRDGYTTVAMKFVSIGNEMTNHIDDFVSDAIDSTRRHSEEQFYYSGDRARFMAENESNTSKNIDEYIKAIESGKSKKTWFAILDRATRHSHREANQQTVPINEPFIINGHLMDFPKDDSYGAPASEIINCRCSVKYF